MDGTLTRRFKGTALEGLFAAKSGRTLIVSAFANDVPEDVEATVEMDKAFVLAAEAN